MIQRQEASENGRTAQRRRTRKAIVDAAIRLLGDHSSPTVDEVAAEADMSRRTIYMHFPTFDQLMLDASIGALSAAEGGPLAQTWDQHDDGPARIEALAKAVLAQSDTTLPLGRRIIRLTVDAPRHDDGGPRRGYRRVQWIEAALEPLRPQLDDEQFARLTAALAVLIGFESMIVLRDVIGADAAEEERVTTWAVRALVGEMLAEAGTSP